MADCETETNPRKKIKTDHNPGQNGDDLKAPEIQTSTDLPQEESSQAITQDKEDVANVIEKDAAKEKEETREEDLSEDKSKETGRFNLKGNTYNVNDSDSDDDMIDDRDGRRNMDLSDSESDVSALSDMSSLSGEDSWKAAPAGPMAWVMKCMEDGVDPRSILSQIIPDEKDIPDVDDFTLWKLVVNLVSEPPPRNKLPDVNTLEDVIQLLKKCEKIMVLTGAGVSVSCGIPDFRSRNGIYARLAVDFPDLPDPQAMFDIRYFRRDQRPFFKFAKEIYPGQFEPSRSHKFIKLIEDHGKLLRNYTQNIDTLEQVAGIKNVIQCHGSFAAATCMTCHHKCSSDDIREQIMDQVIPKCPECEPQTSQSVLKPDIVFFGESLPEEFHHQMSVDKDDCDLLIVIGSSLKVRPVALIPNSLPSHVPQILINKEHLRNLNFDVELLGDCDKVVGEICRRLGDDWAKIAGKEHMTQITMDELLTPTSSPKAPEKESDKPELKTDETKCKVDQEKTENSENVDNVTSTSTEARKNTNNAEASETKSDGKCSCNKDVGEDNENVSVGNENVGEDNENVSVGNKKTDSNKVHVCKSNDKNLAEDGNTKSTESGGNNETQGVKDETEPEPSDTGTTKKEVDCDTTTTIGQGNSANAETKTVSKTDNCKVGDDAKPGCSSEDNQKPSSTADLKKPRKTWGSYRQNVSLRLGTNQFCFVPTHKYIFPEAEYFTWVKSDSESDSDTDHDRDTTLDSSRELNLTNRTTTDSSAMDGDFIDLTSDDEDDKGVASSEDVKKGADKDITASKNSDVKTDRTDPGKGVQDNSPDIVID